MKPAANAIAELIGSEVELVAIAIALGAAGSGGPLAKAGLRPTFACPIRPSAHFVD